MLSTASSTSQVLGTCPPSVALLRRPAGSLTTPEHPGKRDNCWMRPRPPPTPRARLVLLLSPGSSGSSLWPGGRQGHCPQPLTCVAHEWQPKPEVTSSGDPLDKMEAKPQVGPWQTPPLTWACRACSPCSSSCRPWGSRTALGPVGVRASAGPGAWPWQSRPQLAGVAWTGHPPP